MNYAPMALFDRGGDRLRDSTELKAVLADSPVVILAFDSTETLTLREGADSLLFGLDDVLTIGSSLADLADAAPILTDLISRALDGESTSSQLESGGHHFDFRCRPTRDGEDRVTGVVAIGHDVTERVTTDAQSEQLNVRFRTLVYQSADVGSFRWQR
jgi:PAS domain-containing protein